ncbi:MAG TPA: ribosome-associated translation inhibitor RaiA [Candidatus Lustribacter sp.]|nr:ribosome-associated translation inhibitor RaiA [Candidatus Lustribacter sp.]
MFRVARPARHQPYRSLQEDIVEIVVTGRHVQLSDRFRQHIEDKLAKIEQLAPEVHRVDVVVTHEPTARKSERVEVTCHAKGPVIRAEAAMDDRFAAFESAFDKTTERLRRAQDRRRVRRGRRTPESVGSATARIVPPAESAAPTADQMDLDGQGLGTLADSPIEVREKVHTSRPMTLEEALTRMELVGHDFFLYHDRETGKPSVVYRRRGWAYGVIHLDLHGADDHAG